LAICESDALRAFYSDTAQGTLLDRSERHDWCLLMKRQSASSFLLKINDEEAEQTKIQSVSDFFQK